MDYERTITRRGEQRPSLLSQKSYQNKEIDCPHSLLQAIDGLGTTHLYIAHVQGTTSPKTSGGRRIYREVLKMWAKDVGPKSAPHALWAPIATKKIGRNSLSSWKANLQLSQEVGINLILSRIQGYSSYFGKFLCHVWNFFYILLYFIL